MPPDGRVSREAPCNGNLLFNRTGFVICATAIFVGRKHRKCTVREAVGVNGPPETGQEGVTMSTLVDSQRQLDSIDAACTQIGILRCGTRASPVVLHKIPAEWIVVHPDSCIRLEAPAKVRVAEGGIVLVATSEPVLMEGNGYARVGGKAHVTLVGHMHADVWGDAQVTAFQDCEITARGHALVNARGRTHVHALEHAHVKLAQKSVGYKDSAQCIVQRTAPTAIVMCSSEQELVKNRKRGKRI